MSIFNVFEIDGGSGGYNYLEVFDGSDNLIGWIVVANTTHTYDGTTFTADHEYFYFEEDVTQYSEFKIKLSAASTTWPRTWPYNTTANTVWDTSNVKPTTYASQNPNSGVSYYSPKVSSPGSNINWLGWKWPTSSVNGSNEWWATTADYTLGGTVGTSWVFESSSASTIYGYRVIQPIPRQ